jgi:hypothetical protein
MKKWLLTAYLFGIVLALPTQADFFQCVAMVICNGSLNADVMNGSSGEDDIRASVGNDIIFGGDGRDGLDGQDHDDFILGGLGSDQLFGFSGNDVIVPGPDDAGEVQSSAGFTDNDTFIVLVSETINCQLINAGDGFDVLHLIGFGPYVVEFPYGAVSPIAVDSAIIIQDPIAGGYIIVRVSDQGPNSLERINGLDTPNVTVLDPTASANFFSANCTIANPN